jgi:hypothetical protein
MNFALILMLQNQHWFDYYYHQMIIAKYEYNYLENKLQQTIEIMLKK